MCDQPAAEIRKAIVGASSFDDVGCAPEIPIVRLGQQHVQDAVEVGHLVLPHFQKLLAQQFNLLLAVSFGSKASLLDEAPKSRFLHGTVVMPLYHAPESHHGCASSACAASKRTLSVLATPEEATGRHLKNGRLPGQSELFQSLEVSQRFQALDFSAITEDQIHQIH